MLAYTLKRLGLAILVALFVSAVAFALLRLSGDPALAIAGEGAREADIEMVRKTYGLDRPLAVQYFEWLWTILRGDLGQSLYFRTDGFILPKPLKGVVPTGHLHSSTYWVERWRWQP